MNQNRITFLALVVAVIFGGCFGLFIIGSNLYEGIADRQTLIERLKKDKMDLGTQRMKLETQKKQIERVRATALPGNTALATNVYRNFLRELLLKHRFDFNTFTDSTSTRMNTGAQRGQASAINVISFHVVADAPMGAMLSFLQDFYRHNLPHEIRHFSVVPMGRGNEAKNKVDMEIEVLSLSNVPDRESVFPVPDPRVTGWETLAALNHMPTGLLTGISQFTPSGLYGNPRLASESRPARDYAAMLQKNIFSGLIARDAAPTPAGARPPDKGILKDTQLTYITANYITEEGMLRVRPTNKYVRLRAEGGVNTFEVRDGSDQVVLKGKVLAIKPRDLVFESGGKVYVLHVGQFIEDAMKKELSPEELKKLDPELAVEIHEKEVKEVAEPDKE